ncbi:developmental protein [Cryptosporidium canis]|uniref:Developmental protein n=1 Tax=Cryptosporidium canis TaxID=195482 RepID=A0ABQ8PB49_9CRYT|nr:developmental protein [Cryptosporidium canis]KAJ1614630.1 developmental protein [Cryptosporidium canis]
MGNKVSIDDSIFELKLQKKGLERQYNKRDRDSKNERKKAKDALISGKPDLSKIYAENSLRMQEECRELLLMVSKLDQLCARLERASSKEKISSQLLEIIPRLKEQLSEEGVMGYSNMNRIREIGQLLNIIEDSQPEILEENVGAEECMHKEKSIEGLLDELINEHAIEIDEVISSKTEPIEILEGLSKNKASG